MAGVPCKEIGRDLQANKAPSLDAAWSGGDEEAASAIPLAGAVRARCMLDVFHFPEVELVRELAFARSAAKLASGRRGVAKEGILC